MTANGLLGSIPSESEIRAELEAMVVGDLLGPAGGESEGLTERTVRDRYIVGVLAPSRSGEGRVRFLSRTLHSPLKNRHLTTTMRTHHSSLMNWPKAAVTRRMMARPTKMSPSLLATCRRLSGWPFRSRETPQRSTPQRSGDSTNGKSGKSRLTTESNRSDLHSSDRLKEVQDER
jgi:hypothetical protein